MSPAPPPDNSSHSKLQKEKFFAFGKQHQPTKSISPRMSPAKFLQDQGGIEGMIHEAAQGVYSRGEKWGVGKALRDAVQVLQSGDNIPRRVSNGSRWSLDDGRDVPNTASMSEKLHALEQRNKALAKLLETAMAELWVQQNEFAKNKANTAADAVSIAIAKVQFVQVYLENPGIPIPNENSTTPDAPHDETKEISNAAPEIKAEGPDEKEKPLPPAPVIKTTPEKILPDKCEPDESSDSAPTPSKSLSEPSSTISSNADSTDSKFISHLSPVSFHQPRPSLAHSSFSWMLGEDQRKSSFVSASPFPSEKRSARAKAGFLFGDDGKGKKGFHTPKDKSSRVIDEEDEVITLGDLNAGT